MEGSPGLIANLRQENGITIIELSGRLDAVSAEQIKQELYELIEEGSTRLLLNMAQVEFIDSHGLGLLVSCLRRTAAEGGDLSLVEVPELCRSVLELTRLTRVFDIYESEDKAVTALRSA